MATIITVTIIITFWKLDHIMLVIIKHAFLLPVCESFSSCDPAIQAPLVKCFKNLFLAVHQTVSKTCLGSAMEFLIRRLHHPPLPPPKRCLPVLLFIWQFVLASVLRTNHFGSPSFSPLQKCPKSIFFLISYIFGVQQVILKKNKHVKLRRHASRVLRLGSKKFGPN